MENKSNLVPLPVLARRIRVPGRWLRLEAEANRIPNLKAGNQFLFNVEAVERVLAERASPRKESREHAV